MTVITPAVTPGTFICTSSTRPASPFAGQQIYETDTSKSLIYNGTAWVAPQAQTAPPMCSVYRSSDLTGYAGSSLVTWQAADYDTESPLNPMWAAGGNANKVYIRTAGVYSVSLRYYFTAAATISLLETDFFINAGVSGVTNTPVHNATQAYGLTTYTQKYAQGDYIAVGFAPTGGSAFVVKGSATDNFQQTRLTVAFLGKTA